MAEGYRTVPHRTTATAVADPVTAHAAPAQAQVVSSASGGLMDEFTLTKPPGWTFTPRKLEGDEEGEGVGAGSSGAGVLRVGGPAPYPGDAAMVAAA